jgi:GT2 family glycosyltransferase
MLEDQLDLSICIVSFQARAFLRQCLVSLIKETSDISKEVIVVDNGSSDGTEEMLIAEFPDVQLIKNANNTGYTFPMNQALRASSGRYIVQLNPDTIILPGAFQNLIGFMEQNSRAGICGPKVLNDDGTLQGPCRRGEPRPLAVVGYTFRLGRLFPKNKVLNEYLLSYQDENETHLVAGVSGSCMVIRREVVDQIGYLDERFFAYQEDADYCRRTRDAGWQVFYVPTAQIIHYGGRGGSRVQPWRSILEWHLSYFRYYRKHLARDYIFLFNWLYYCVIGSKLAYALLANLFRKKRFAGPQR